MSALCQKRTFAPVIFSLKTASGSPTGYPCCLLNCLQRLRQFLVQSASLVVAELIWLQNNGQFRERAGEGERHLALIPFQHRGSRVLSYVECFIEREANTDCLGNATLRDLLFVHQ